MSVTSKRLEILEKVGIWGPIWAPAWACESSQPGGDHRGSSICSWIWAWPFLPQQRIEKPIMDWVIPRINTISPADDKGKDRRRAPEGSSVTEVLQCRSHSSDKQLRGHIPALEQEEWAGCPQVLPCAGHCWSGHLHSEVLPHPGCELFRNLSAQSMEPIFVVEGDPTSSEGMWAAPWALPKAEEVRSCSRSCLLVPDPEIPFFSTGMRWAEVAVGIINSRGEVFGYLGRITLKNSCF